MKSVFFTVAAGILFTLFSCNSDETAAQNEMSKTEIQGELIVISRTTDPTIIDPANPNHPGHPDYWPTKPSTPAGGGELPPYEVPFEQEYIAFNGNDIKSFNVTTGEIIFASSSTADDLNKRIVGLFVKLAFYLGEKPSLVADVYSPLSSYFYHDLVFVIEDSKFYLLDGYPTLDKIGNSDGDGKRKTEIQQIRKDNAQKRKTEWNAFIRYLTDAGKIVN
jgi:RNA recognition motif-containing protein